MVERELAIFRDDLHCSAMQVVGRDPAGLNRPVLVTAYNTGARLFDLAGLWVRDVCCQPVAIPCDRRGVQCVRTAASSKPASPVAAEADGGWQR